VEAVFEGEEKDVQAMVEFCRHGPPGAFVMSVELTWEPYAAEFSNFRIRYVTPSSWTP
jgi:acylphosphatase